MASCTKIEIKELILILCSILGLRVRNVKLKIIVVDQTLVGIFVFVSGLRILVYIGVIAFVETLEFLSVEIGFFCCRILILLLQIPAQFVLSLIASNVSLIICLIIVIILVVILILLILMVVVLVSLVVVLVVIVVSSVDPISLVVIVSLVLILIISVNPVSVGIIISIIFLVLVVIGVGVLVIAPVVFLGLVVVILVVVGCCVLLLLLFLFPHLFVHCTLSFGEGLLVGFELFTLGVVLEVD